MELSDHRLEFDSNRQGYRCVRPGPAGNPPTGRCHGCGAFVGLKELTDTFGSDRDVALNARLLAATIIWEREQPGTIRRISSLAK